MVYYKEKGDANIMLKIPKKFEPCFWDTEFNKLDTEENKYYIISRLYNKDEEKHRATMHIPRKPGEVFHFFYIH